ncbi:MAG: MarR family transcriptional regulator [Methylobacterium mesophilicum]|nr:MarR family transcriptional regulator [Methylobacterium mesophilicum]
MTQADIAKRLGLSAATVSRLLQRARAEGIVRIEVRDLASPQMLVEGLIGKLGLKKAAVVEAPGAAGALASLARPVGDMLREEGIRSGSVLAVGWGRAVRAVIEAGLPALGSVTTVSANGGMQQHALHFQVNEFVRQAAEQLGGMPRFIHAPYLPSRESRAAFLADPDIARNVALWDEVDAAIVGIGVSPATTAPEARIATPDEQAITEAAGDVIRHYFRADGSLIDWEGESRMIAMTPEQLRRTPLVIGMAVGPSKAAGIIGAARAGLVSALVTDTQTAEAILDRA